jgi:hypothetical protein
VSPLSLKRYQDMLRKGLAATSPFRLVAPLSLSPGNAPSLTRDLSLNVVVFVGTGSGSGGGT